MEVAVFFHFYRVTAIKLFLGQSWCWCSLYICYQAKQRNGRRSLVGISFFQLWRVHVRSQRGVGSPGSERWSRDQTSFCQGSASATPFSSTSTQQRVDGMALDLENLISLPFCLDNHLRKRRRERARTCQLSHYSPFSFPKVASVKGPASSSAQMPAEPGEPSQLGNPFREIEETLCYDLPVLWPTYSLLRLLSNRAKKPLLPQTLVSGDSSCLLR